MKKQCDNCNEILEASGLIECPECLGTKFTHLHEEKKIEVIDTPKPTRIDKSAQPSIKGFFAYIAWWLGVAFVLFLIGGFLTDGYGTGDDGNVPGKECQVYEKPNGDWANTCDL